MRTRQIAIVGVLLGLITVSVSIGARPQHESKGSAVTFNKEVLPILQKNCQTCHRPGQVAPMSFLTYDSTRPWAKAMKVQVTTRQMPPWSADPRYGPFANDRSLKQAEIDTLAAWVDQGAPEGAAQDKPPA